MAGAGLVRTYAGYVATGVAGAAGTGWTRAEGGAYTDAGYTGAVSPGVGARAYAG